jgi:hypothetical protein
MDFKTTDFKLETYDLAQYLGIPDDIYAEAYTKRGEENYISWHIKIVTEDWGISSIRPVIDRIRLNIEWEIPRSDISHNQIAHIKHEYELTDSYVRGVLDDFRFFRPIVDFDQYIERVSIDFLNGDIILQ